jgi:hypothetical protein
MKKKRPSRVNPAVATKLACQPPNQALTMTAVKKNSHGAVFRYGHVAELATNATATAKAAIPNL